MSFPVGDDWRPLTLAGTFRDGYARFETSGGLLIQVKWKSARTGDHLNRKVLEYFSRLESGAKKRRLGFQGDFDLGDSFVDFSWHAGVKGYGRLLWDSETRRTVLVEQSGDAKKSFKREAREWCQAVKTFGGPTLPWSLLGLRLQIPDRFTIRDWKLFSGRITLNFLTRGSRMIVDRWSFAEQLTASKGLRGWGESATGLAASATNNEIVTLEGGRWPKRARAIVVHQEDRNQLVVLRSEGRRPELPEPAWVL